MITMNAAGNPIQVNSKKPRGVYPFCTSRPETIRFVEVPIRVTVPPMMAA